MDYHRENAVAYAHAWAFKRNPRYYCFDAIGGDCTSFISQCLFAGCGVMNYARDTGWYYRFVNDRAPAWAGVEFLYRFLVSNKKTGPYGEVLPLPYTQPGDIIQLSFNGEKFAHSLFVVGVTDDDILIATHTDDSDNRALNTYRYQKCRLLHITGVRS